MIFTIFRFDHIYLKNVNHKCNCLNIHIQVGKPWMKS